MNKIINISITSIDHIVLTVKNIDETVQFYESVLGMTAEKFGEGRVSLRFGSQKINLHQHGQEFELKANRPTPGSGDICFITETELELAMEHTRRCGVKIVEGPVARTGATGALTSFYFRDPDSNLIEVANYSKE
ncbi:MAG: VOC family protein [Deltaproteobacteria bacterium]|nr:VOC family protein [Deltaproteobacteria bacterium]